MIDEKSRVYGRTKEISIDALKNAFASSEADFIKVALLFGSRAVGRQHARSDYDFALLMDEKCDAPWGVKAKAYNLIEDLLGLDACDIDIVDLKSADNVVRESIKEGYIVLKGEADAVSGLLG